MTKMMELLQIVVALIGFAITAVLIKDNKIPAKLMDLNLYALVGVMFLVILGFVVVGTLIHLPIIIVLVTGMCSAILVHKTFDVFK